MEHILDCMGMACPKPVILTKKELERPETTSVTTKVDNRVATENLAKLAASMGATSATREEKGAYYVTITKGAGSCPAMEFGGDALVIAVSSDTLGRGDEALGKILIKSFLYTVREDAKKPKAMLFFNRGVFLTTEGSPVLEDLRALADAGVEIVSCGTCLDFFNRKDALAVGSIGNMYLIYETMRSADHLVEV